MLGNASNYKRQRSQSKDQPARASEAPARAGRLGLSSPHISPDMITSLPKIGITPGGGLVNITLGKGDYLGDSHGGGPRKEITKMTAESRRRLQCMLAQLAVDVTPIFVTLTYPGKGLQADTKKLKRDIDVFGKALKKMGCSFVWRMEFKRRKTGEFAGEIIPHLHLFLWGMSYRDALETIPNLWYRVVDSGDTDHLAAGTRVEEIHSWGGVCSYTAKYISKQDEEDIPAGCGRFWGVVNRKGLPLIPLSSTDVLFTESVEFMRLARRYANVGRTGKKKIKLLEDGRRVVTNRRLRFRSSSPTMNLIIRNSDRWFDLLFQDSSLAGSGVGAVPVGTFLERHFDL